MQLPRNRDAKLCIKCTLYTVKYEPTVINAFYNYWKFERSLETRFEVSKFLNYYENAKQWGIFEIKVILIKVRSLYTSFHLQLFIYIFI